MQEKFKLLAQALGKERIKFDEPLKYHLAVSTDASAKCFYIATTIKELEQVLNLTDELKIPFSIFGAGTKILLTDYNLEGLVIKNRTSGIKISGVKGKVSNKGIGVEEAMVEVESGVSMQKLNEFLKVQGLAIFDSGMIPESTIGGTLYINNKLQDASQKTKVWSDSQVFDIDILELKRTDIILSTRLKIKSSNKA